MDWELSLLALESRMWIQFWMESKLEGMIPSGYSIVCYGSHGP